MTPTHSPELTSATPSQSSNSTDRSIRQAAPITPRGAALVAGVGYVVIFVLGIFANFFVRTGLIDPDNAAATFANITDSEFLFRAGVASFLIIFIADLVVAWALYVVFRAVSKELSLLTAWFRLIYTVFLGVAAIFLFRVLELIGDAAHLGVWEQGQRESQVMLAAEAFNYTWLIGLAVFGVHLILIGYMMLVSGIAPKALGIVLAVAGTAYVVDTLGYALLSNYADYANVFLVIVAIPSVIGELAFTVWLLARGGKRQPAIS